MPERLSEGIRIYTHPKYRLAVAWTLAATSGVSDFTVLKDPSTGTPVAQGDAADAAAIFTFTMTSSDGTAQPMAMLLDCRTAGQTEILLTAVAPTSKFASEAAAFEAIDRGVVLNPGSSQPTSAVSG